MHSLFSKLFVFLISLSSASVALATQSYIYSAPAQVGTAAALVTVTVTFDSPGVVATSRVLTQGSPNLDYTDAGGGSCAVGSAYLAGQSCTVFLAFTPRIPGSRPGAVVLSDASKAPLATTYIYAVAAGGLGVFVPSKIQTIAGSSSFVFSGDGGLAASAGLKLPTGIALDGAGDLFIADTGHNRVRRVDAATKIITTVAGNGTSTYQGDGGLATLAGLSGPSVVALDGAGNLYISDSGNSVVRVVNVFSGIIKTVAGNGSQGYSGDLGPATSATLNTPSGLAADNASHLYIADSASNVVRQLNLLTGIITTVAGTGVQGFAGDGLPATAAFLNAPGSVATDSAGMLYIADTNNNRIRLVNASGIITTVVGSGSTPFAGDGGPATSANIFIPSGLAIDVAGNIYVSDTGNDVIRKINKGTGIITTIAGNGGQNFNGDGNLATGASIFAPYALAIGRQGDLLIADSFHNRIRQISATASVSFPQGKFQVGQTTPTTLQPFENDGNANLTISSITSNANASVDPVPTTCTAAVPLTTDQACVLGVRATPSVAGTLVVGTITVADDASNSPGIIQIGVNAVAATATSTSVTSSANPAALGASVTLTALVTGTGTTVPTGTVTFLDGSTVLGSTNLVPSGSGSSTGTALFAISTLALGVHPITVSYAGDISNLSSISPAINQAIVLPTNIALASSLNPSLGGVPVTFTATVAGSSAVPTGTVTFTDAGVTIGTGVLNQGGVATFQTATLTGGTHAIAASYPGDSNTAPGVASVLIQTVVSSATGTDLLSSATTLAVGQPLTLTAAVSGSRGTPPSGTVTFYNGTTSLGVSNLDANGVGQITLTPAAGNYSITATYSGDAKYATSVSSATIVVVSFVADFSVTATPASFSLQSGKSALVSLTFTSLHGFASTLALGCAQAPALANCTFPQNSVTLSANGTQTVQFAVNTFPLNVGEMRPSLANRTSPSLALLLPGGLLFGLLVIVERKGPFRNKRNIFRTLLFIALTSLGIGALNGCGGSTVHTTTAGTYTVLVSATDTSSGNTHTIPLQLTVTK